MSRYSDAVNYEGVDPESDGEMMIVYAEQSNERINQWVILNAEDREFVEIFYGNHTELVQYCLDSDYDLRDGPLSAY